jgi:hypothetical protein
MPGELLFAMCRPFRQLSERLRGGVGGTHRRLGRIRDVSQQFFFFT